MRVYTRVVDTGLMIDNRIQVNVLEVQSDRVRLAIIDPDATPSYREEVLFLKDDDEGAEEFAGVDHSGCEFPSAFEVAIEESQLTLEGDNLFVSSR